MLFPAECQEFIQRDQRGERHIADVCLPHGQVIEFQHSHLCPQERIARESFHKNMWWVVDGARLSRDFPRFAAAFPSFRPLWQGVYVTPFPEEAFPLSWLNSDVPVFFDFESAVGVPQDKLFVTRALWCLLPRRPLGQAVVFALSKETFTRMAQDEAQSKLPEAIRSKAEEILDLERQVRVARLRAAQMSMRQQQALRYRRRPPRF